MEGRWNDLFPRVLSYSEVTYRRPRTVMHSWIVEGGQWNCIDRVS